MIGQAELILKLRKTTAKTVLITGPAHWGKKTLLRYIFKNDESVYEVSGNAATFRETLERIYQTVRPTTYLIPDIDKANQTIQNMLLKILEEPPASARFFLTASGPILQTITSRCVSFRMQPYKDVHEELGGLQCPVQLIGMFNSPGELQLINFPEVADIIFALVEMKTDIETRSLAVVLKSCKNLNWKLKEAAVTPDAFLILARNVFGDSQSIAWLRSQPEDAVQQVRAQFFMNLWIERQVLAT